MSERAKEATPKRARAATRPTRLVRTPIRPGQAAKKATERPMRGCHNCVFCISDSLLWARTLLSGFPLTGMCANHPATPGQLREIPHNGPCRNFRPKPGSGRVESPDPPNDRIRYIPLTRGLHAIVDAKNYEWLSRYKWHAWVAEHVGTHYACRTRRGRTFYGCSNYQPNSPGSCNFATWKRPLPQPCPQCGGLLTQVRKGWAQCTNCEVSVETEMLSSAERVTKRE